MSFINLHNHSHYSILEGLPKPQEYVKKAKELGMNAVAITDSGNLHGCHELYKSCKSEGITPILGTEINVESYLDNKLNHKLVLLAKSLNGYKNIISLVSKANLDSDGKSSKITLDDILELKNEVEKNSNKLDIVCLSGPISGEIPYYILSGKNDEEIVSRINNYSNIFGKDNYYLELIYHDDIPKQRLVTDKLIDISNKYEIPVVATNNSFYINKDDSKTQDVIQALGTGHELENPDRPTKINGDYSFLNEEEMQSLFGFIPEAIENSGKIADMVNIEIETGGILIPTFELPEEDNKIYMKALEIEKNEKKIKKLDSSEWYLRYLSFKGLNWRFNYGLDKKTIFEFIKKLDKPSLDKKLQDTSPEELKSLSLTYYTNTKKKFLKKLDISKQEYIERLEYELVVIHEMGFDGYFLIVADYINWARENNIPVGPGRGSAAGSVMAYLSGITDLDPIEYGLIFERFLNPARVSMPDIDTDFADNDLYKVVNYCRQKYGEDKVVRVCTFGTFAARAAVKDVGRVYGILFSEMNELVKLIPEKPGTKLKGALEDSIEFKEAYETNKKYKEIIDNALKIEGNVRQLGVHACAVIIAPESMTNFTALQHPPKDATQVVTQYSAYPLEDLGLLKMDFLGLRNLTIIKRCTEIIKNSKGKDIDTLKLDMDDQKVFKIFGDGDTTGIFQFESDGMRKYLRDLGPNCFEDLIAMVSLYRPGPLAYIPTFIERKHGREKVEYPHESLEEILSPTQGIAVYQEQIMKMVQVFAGFSLGAADILRRAIGKKKIDVLMAQKKIFIDAAKSLGHAEKLATHIFEDVIEPFAGYGFNKSHAACYAFISYQTAYLKAYYPTEFLTSVMVSDEENMDRIVIEVGECESKGISVLPPSIQESLKHFTYINDKNIRFGLKAIKGIGEGPIDKIIKTREQLFKDEKRHRFQDLEEFIMLCGTEVINKRSLEALIMSGAMDELGERKQMFESIQDMIRYCKRDEKKKESNQIGLFDNSDSFEDKLELVKTDKFSFEEKLRGEKEMIGFCVSGHPLDNLQKYCAKRSINTKKLKMEMDELLELDKIQNPEKYKETKEEDDNNKAKKPKKEIKEEIVQCVGVVTDLRKIITKTGKNMMFLKCEGFDYDFEVVIFPKDIEKYQDKIELDKIIIVNGSLDINFEYSRKSIRARDIKIASISQVREQAKDLSLTNDKKRLMNKKLNEYTENKEEGKINQKNNSKENFETKLDENINLNKSENKEQVIDKEYIIQIPKNAKKEDLVNLKSFLEELDKGLISVYINLNGNKIYTKIDILNLVELQNWEKSYWK